jgi:2-dehydro-3-deoxyphosphogluconate aldolase / (4S)-4-hydroxy-2-oxoglutarate aldolase
VTTNPDPDHSPLADARFVFIARRADPTVMHEALVSLTVAGLRHVEITFDSDGAAETIADLRDRLPGVVLGAGTIKTAEQVTRAVAAGARFVVSPHGSEALCRAARDAGVEYVPGAFTPTEAMTAWEWGVPLVKLFPIETLGTGFLKQFRGPCPEIKLIVTGGVRLDNAVAFRQAGASAVGMGSELLTRWRQGTDQDRATLVDQFADLLAALA